MELTQPYFKPGDRCFSHYVMGWGTVEKITDTRRGDKNGVTGEPMPDTTWYRVKMDKGGIEHFDDCHGDWENARMMPPHIAKEYNYGDDPNPPHTDCGLCEAGVSDQHNEDPPMTDRERAELMEESRDVEEGRRERQEFYRNRDYRDF